MSEFHEALAMLLKAVSGFFCAFDSAVVASLPNDAARVLMEAIAANEDEHPMLATLNAHARAARDACTQWERTNGPINGVATAAVRDAAEAVLKEYRRGSNVIDLLKR